MKNMTQDHKKPLPPKVEFISECCEATAEVENEYADGSGEPFYTCTKCGQPCELIGYVEKGE